MSLRKEAREIERLKVAFEAESLRFHDVSLSTYFITQEHPNDNRQFKRPNHTIVLWQYYGRIDGGSGVDSFIENLRESNLQWGVRGSQLSRFAVLEGQGHELFVRMAKRAGCLFSKNDASILTSHLRAEILQKLEKNDDNKPLLTTNDNPLAIWINYLIYYASIAFPGRERAEKVEPDPFTLSLLALESLSEHSSVEKSDRSTSDIEKIKFRVSVSFPGELRVYVSKVVSGLRKHLAGDAVFYDFDYQAQLARPDLDLLLQAIYRDRSELLVVFLNKNYAEKEWCGLEWRAVRDIIKTKESRRVMLIRFDESDISGLFSIDGYIDGRKTTPRKTASYILQRLDAIQQ